MARRRRYSAISAQQIDPLSWFTGPLLPLAFATLMFIYCVVVTVITWGVSDHPELQFVGLGLCVSACLIIHFSTRPLRQAIGWRTAAAALALSVAGFEISAIDYAGTDFEVGTWWAPAGLSLTLASLGPYLPARKILALGLAATLVAVPLVFVTVYPTSRGWGPVGTAVFIAYPMILALVATTTFSYSVVSTMLPMLENSSRVPVIGQAVRDEATARIEHVTLARLTARAAPFLESIADAGRITPADRALAGQLARRLRDELVTQANLSWLDSIAAESRLVVVDPDRLAQQMKSPQRTALRALLRALLDLPQTDRGSLMIELRKAADGATAVAVSLDMSLPEGRRIMHLAPYYLTLKTAVDGLTFDRETLQLSFRIAEEPFGVPPLATEPRRRDAGASR